MKCGFYISGFLKWDLQKIWPKSNDQTSFFTVYVWFDIFDDRPRVCVLEHFTNLNQNKTQSLGILKLWFFKKL